MEQLQQYDMEDFYLEATREEKHDEIERLIDCEMIVDLARNNYDRKRLEQHIRIKTIFNDFYSTEIDRVYMDIGIKMRKEKQRQLEAKGIAVNDDTQLELRPELWEYGVTAPTLQDYILKWHYHENHFCNVTINECSRLRYHTKVIELEETLRDAGNHANCTWHQNSNPESQYYGHWYVTMNDVHLGPTDTDEQPLPIGQEPIITRRPKNVPMGNCENCYKMGRIRTPCVNCEEEDANHTLNFHGSRTRITDRTGIVDPRELEHACIIQHDNVIIYPMQDRTIIPFRWEAVKYYHLKDFIEDHVLDKMGEDWLDEYQMRDMARALKYDYAYFKKKYQSAFKYRCLGIVSDDESEAASATSIDKNTIG